jgi:hypothetical protein
MDTDDWIAVLVAATLTGLLATIALSLYRKQRPARAVVIAFAVALVLSFFVVAEEAV